MYSSFLFLLLFFLLFIHFLVLKVLLELVEAFAPKPLVLVHPSCYLAEWFTSKRNEDLATLFPAFNESSSFEQLKVFADGIQSSVKRFRDIQESGGAVC